MNDKDKEAFEQWVKSKLAYAPTPEDYENLVEFKDIIELGWRAACEYKKEEYSNIMEAMTQTSQYNFKLQAENAKLRECLEFTTHAAEYLYKPDVKLNRGMSPTFYFTLTYEGDLELMEKTKIARQVLKELESK